MDIEVNSITINDFVLKNVNTNLITFISVILSIALIQAIVLQCVFFVKTLNSFKGRSYDRSFLPPSLDH